MDKNYFYINDGWQISECGNGEEETLMSELIYKREWIDAKVPGDVHVDLFRAGKIRDPYFSDYSKECAWITEKDWLFKKTFILPANFKKEKTKLIFEGIDTYSTIWVNGIKIGITDNMFREFAFDISELVNENEDNEIIVKVKSIKKMMETFEYQKYFACFNTARIFARKAQCHFGWDWAPELPATGLWQGVKIESKLKGHLENVQVVSRLSGEISFFVKVDRKPTINELAQSKEAIKHEKIEDELLIQIYDEDVICEKRIGVRGGKNHVTLEVENPKLWWPNGYGEPNLYNYKVTLIRKNVEIETISGRFGIREIELKQEPLKEGGFNFQFNVNKIPIYCKGSNWVPLDCFTGTINPEKYQTMLRLAKEAHFNMLRIWGGGIYEKEIFYEICDENGIMVWQDFMFACSDVPDDQPLFHELVIPEIEYQVKRLRNHPSIVYWCGGNEKTGSSGLKVSYGERMLHYIIRGICGDLDPTRPYGAASPRSYSDLGNDQDSGDTHCNCLEHSFKRGMTVFRDEIEKIKAAFNSECAIQGPSRYKSVIKFIPEDKLWPLNELWRFRYKDNPYNTLVEEYLDIQFDSGEILFGKCNNVKDFIKKAMTAHAEILRAEIEYQRCRKWTNSGFMFWMYSDIWPTGTWAVVDYYATPKMAFYAVSRAYNPLLVSIQQIQGDIKVYISNDLLEDLDVAFEIGQKTIEGKVIWKESINRISIDKNERINVASVGGKVQKISDSYLFASASNDKYSTRTTFFHDMWKDINWAEPSLSLKELSEQFIDGEYIKTVEITAKKFARAVNLNLNEKIYAFFSDNFFDLEADEVKNITIASRIKFGLEDIKVDHWLTDWE